MIAGEDDQGFIACPLVGGRARARPARPSCHDLAISLISISVGHARLADQVRVQHYHLALGTGSEVRRAE